MYQGNDQSEIDNRSWWGRRRITTKIAIIGFAILGVIFLLGGISNAVGGRPSADNADTPTQQTQQPPQKATAMPAAACPTKAEQSYFSAVGRHSNVALEHVTEIATLGKQAELAPTLLLDPVWQAELDTALRLFTSKADQMAAIKGPPSTGVIRDDLLYSAAAAHEFAALYTEGISSLNPNLFDAAADAMGDANRYIGSAARKMANFCN